MSNLDAVGMPKRQETGSIARTIPLAAQTNIDEIFYSYDGHMKPLGADIVAWALARRIVLDSLSKSFDVPPPVPIDGGIIAACDALLGKELLH
jgi:hypothetical protein